MNASCIALVADSDAMHSDEMYRAILVAFFLLQTVLSYLIPVVGPATSFIHLSWLYSLYCFEYKWSLAGWSLERRLAHLEQNWAYFAGFGSPFTLATFFVPNFVSKGIFALLFPVVRACIMWIPFDMLQILTVFLNPFF